MCEYFCVDPVISGEYEEWLASGMDMDTSLKRCSYCSGTGYVGQWSGDMGFVRQVLCCDCDGTGYKKITAQTHSLSGKGEEAA